jgi:hypothetical protein
VESPALIETARPLAVARLPQVFFVLPIPLVSKTLLDDLFGFRHVPVYVDAFERFVRSQLFGNGFSKFTLLKKIYDPKNAVKARVLNLQKCDFYFKLDWK